MRGHTELCVVGVDLPGVDEHAELGQLARFPRLVRVRVRVRARVKVMVMAGARVRVSARARVRARVRVRVLSP